MSDDTSVSRPSAPVSPANVSGGVNVNSQSAAAIGRDIVGRDNITTTTNITNNYYISDATNQPSSALSRGELVAIRVTPPTVRDDQLIIGADYWATIPGGHFWLGSERQYDHEAKDAELPQHSVYLPEYRIARVPVTVALFERFIQVTHYKTTAEKQGGAKDLVKGLTRDDWPKNPGAYWAHPHGPASYAPATHPVTCISWLDALEFCQWAKVRLPTEAEWEKAAAWDQSVQLKRIYPWGNDLPTRDRCNFDLHVPDTQTTPVGTYSPHGDSAYGLADMAGNVWEWTSSLYRDYPYQADNRDDLQAPGERVLRGGSFYQTAEYVRCAYRNYHRTDACVSDYGFRVCAV